ncbi:hypothetical protein GWO43_31205 [candidate division KSB1 bacterium]|nr:hypothetical protein [candidate division KSB1 bacterium]NIV71086.1 hypothetical protein [Phycisphaerae bacterium]NIR72365.1 hypothetical protein [candidate division KSB1 bacterium]NIS28368.1 hypothetical protein [candidate division KSB1 bacterium]NIT75249.1 hypothetical protein [candidate division KSB1 bacterium]
MESRSSLPGIPGKLTPLKKIIIASLAIGITAAAGILYARQSIQYRFGLAVIILVVSILVSVFLLLLITLLLYDRHRHLLGKIWLVVMSLSVTYLIVDLASGYFLIPAHSPRNMPDRYVHHKLIPNTTLAFVTSEYNYIARINNLALRGRHIELKKPASLYRIVMLGDSFTMGKGVEDDKTFSVVLEKELNEKCTKINNQSVEVVNAGVVSYSPILSYFQLTKYLSPLEPDLVVLNLDMSDLIQEMVYKKIATYGVDGDIIGVDGCNEEKQFIARVIRWINRNLYVTRLVLLNVNKFSKAINIENVVTMASPELLRHTLVEDRRQRKEQWQNLFDSIVKIKNYCNENGIDFLLTIYPWGHQVSKNEWRHGRLAFMSADAVVSDKSVHVINEFSNNNGIDLLNVFPAFRSYAGKSPLYYDHDMHWTQMGHRLMAAELKRYMLSKYLHSRMRAIPVN